METVEFKKRNRVGRVLAGLIIVATGTVLLMRQMGTIFPAWLFTWEMLLIVIGVFIGAKHAFRNGGWLIPVMVGGVFLIDDFIPGFQIGNYIWPILIIAIGLWMTLVPKRNHQFRHRYNRYHRHRQNWDRWKHRHQDEKNECSDVDVVEQSYNEDMIDAVSVFGNVRRIVLSKNFKGGEVTAVLGGMELNLNQADINGKVVLEVNAVLGGIVINVPANWEIQTELTAVMGGVEDKRFQEQIVKNEQKVLVLRGSCVLGGIEIKNY